MSLKSPKTLFKLIQLDNVPIFQQLQLEEALLRTDDSNWCIINKGTPPAIVMGISGKKEKLINQKILQRKPIPVIRRFSGGGTVIVDEHTLFITFICNKDCLQVVCSPEKVHQWAEDFYKDVFPAGFKLRENDYVIGDKKFGGNAQYLRKDRWLHHTSLLWDFKSHHMEYLLLPEKTPTYRAQRDHSEFLCSLKNEYPNREKLQTLVLNALNERFDVNEVGYEKTQKYLLTPHRQATTLVE